MSVSFSTRPTDALVSETSTQPRGAQQTLTSHDKPTQGKAALYLVDSWGITIPANSYLSKATLSAAVYNPWSASYVAYSIDPFSPNNVIWNDVTGWDLISGDRTIGQAGQNYYLVDVDVTSYVYHYLDEKNLDRTKSNSVSMTLAFALRGHVTPGNALSFTGYLYTQGTSGVSNSKVRVEFSPIPQTPTAAISSFYRRVQDTQVRDSTARGFAADLFVERNNAGLVKVEGIPIEHLYKRGYVVDFAQFHMTTNKGFGGSYSYTISRVASNNWSEYTAVANNAPSVGSAITSRSFSHANSRIEQTVTVTSWVKAKFEQAVLAHQRSMSVGFWISSNSNGIMWVSTHEYSDTDAHPYLSIRWKYDPAAVPGATVAPTPLPNPPTQPATSVATAHPTLRSTILQTKASTVSATQPVTVSRTKLATKHETAAATNGPTLTATSPPSSPSTALRTDPSSVNPTALDTPVPVTLNATTLPTSGPTSNPCVPSPCRNGGQCVATLSGFECQSCNAGWEGPTCENAVIRVLLQRATPITVISTATDVVVTLEGVNFHSQMTLFFDSGLGFCPGNETSAVDAQGATWCTMEAGSHYNITLPSQGNSQLQFRCPPGKAQSGLRLLARNPAVSNTRRLLQGVTSLAALDFRLWATSSKLINYIFPSAADCEGFWDTTMDGQGAGGVCVPCPEGGVCVGGGVVVPDVGYWSPDGATRPSQCLVYEACWGAIDPTTNGIRERWCSTGYMGPGCTVCADDHYRVENECVSCGQTSNHSGTLGLLIAVALLVLAVIAAVAAVLPDKWLGVFVTSLVLFQQLIFIGRSSSASFSSDVRDLFNALVVLNFEVEFAKPQCVVNQVSFVDIYWITLGVAVLALLFFVLSVVAHHFWMKYSKQRKNQSAEEEPSRRQSLLRSEPIAGAAATPINDDDDQEQEQDHEVHVDLHRRESNSMSDSEAGARALANTTAMMRQEESDAEEDEEDKPQRKNSSASDLKRTVTTLQQPQGPTLKGRVVQSLLCVGFFLYLQLTTVSFKGLHCVDAEDDFGVTRRVLNVEKTTECYSGAHLGCAVVIWMVVIIYVIFFPAWCFFVAYKAHKREADAGQSLDSRPVSEEAYKFLYSGLKPVFWWFRLAFFVLNFAIALQMVLLSNHIATKISISAVFIVINLFIVSVWWPYQQIQDNVAYITVGVITAVYVLVVLFVMDRPQDTLSYVVLSLLIFFAFVCFAFRYRAFKKWQEQRSLVKDNFYVGTPLSDMVTAGEQKPSRSNSISRDIALKPSTTVDQEHSTPGEQQTPGKPSPVESPEPSSRSSSSSFSSAEPSSSSAVSHDGDASRDRDVLLEELARQRTSMHTEAVLAGDDRDVILQELNRQRESMAADL